MAETSGDSDYIKKKIKQGCTLSQQVDVEEVAVGNVDRKTCRTRKYASV